MHSGLRVVQTLAVLYAALVCVPIAPAAEIDSWTGRTEPLADSTEPLERRLNAALEAAVTRANEAPDRCDPEALYDALRGALARPFIGHTLAETLNHDETLDRRRIRRVDSVYRDLRLLDNISVHWKDLSALIRIGDVLVGVDKIGHFFVEGFGYFEIAYVDGEGIDAAMDWGRHTEDTYFGVYTTGVHSYADLVADFEGMRFWMRVLGASPDPLGSGRRAGRPYVACGRRLWVFGERRWRVERSLDLDDYVTPVWDEAINCSSFRDGAIETLVTSRVDELSAATGVELTCPVDPDACVRARRRYGEYAARLLHPACLDAEPSDRPWWRFWR